MNFNEICARRIMYTTRTLLINHMNKPIEISFIRDWNNYLIVNNNGFFVIENGIKRQATENDKRNYIQ